MHYLQNVYTNQKVNMACNFNCLFENEGLLKVTGSHVLYRCGNIDTLCYYRAVSQSYMWHSGNSYDLE